MREDGRVARALRSGLFRNTLWMLLGQGARIPIQALYFILTARALGASGYGAFVAVASLVAILAPFAGLGSGNILIKNVARDPACFRAYWAKALSLTLLSGTLLVMAVALFWSYFLPSSIPVGMVLSIAIAELILARVGDAAILAFQAFQRLGRTSFLVVLPNISRLAALVVFLLAAPNPSPELWAYFYLLGVLLSTSLAIWLVNSELGTPRWDRTILLSQLKEGFYFSISLSSVNVYNDIDKTILARQSSLEAAGVYGAAYKIIDVAFLPVRSLLAAAYARFFQSGVDGVRGTLAFARKLLPLATGYAALSSLLLYFTAPLLPWILGNEYRQAAEALRWLAPLPILRALQYFAADSLTGAGYQGVRSLCQLATAVLNVGLTLWLVPRYSWKGAAWASVATDLFLTVVAWGVTLWLSRQEKLAASSTTPDRQG